MEQIDRSGIPPRKRECAMLVEVAEFFPRDNDSTRRTDVEYEIAGLQFSGGEGTQIIVGPLTGPAPFPRWIICKTAVDCPGKIDCGGFRLQHREGELSRRLRHRS